MVVHRLLDPALRWWVGGEDRSGAALIIVENAVVQGGDQLVLRTEVVIKGADTHGRSPAHFLHVAAGFANLDDSFEGRMKNLASTLSRPTPAIGTRRH